MTRTGSTTLVLVVVALAAGVPTAAPADHHGNESDPGVTELSTCATITEPGRYRLVANVTNSSREECILIRADDVVFDGGGHVIDGQGPDVGDHRIPIRIGYSNYVRVENVTVRNVVVTEWHQGVGISRASNNTVRNVTSRHSGEYGIYLGDHADDNTVVDNTVVDGGNNGLFLANLSNDNRILNNTVRRSDNGIAVFASARNLVANNTAVNNSQNGIAVEGEHNRVVHNEVRRNDNDGISVLADDNTVADNAARDNAGAGIRADGDDNRVANNEVRRNQVGIGVTGSGNVVANNTVINGTSKGIVVAGGARGNAVRDNDVRSNGRLGIQLLGSRDTFVRNNTVRANARDGFLLVNATDSRLVDNAAVANDRWDFRVRDGSTNVTVSRFAVSTGNATAPTTLSVSGREVAVAAVDTVPAPPVGTTAVGRAFAVETTAPAGYLDASVAYRDDDLRTTAEPSLSLYAHREGSWSRLPSTVDAAANAVSATVTESATVAILGNETGETGETGGPTVAAYTNANDVVTTDGLLTAVGDWASGRVDTALLRAVIDAWARGEPVG